jgi:putative hydrolase of the HAD superfamily
MTNSAASRLIETRGVTLISFDLDDTLVDTDAAAPARFEAVLRAVVDAAPATDRALLTRAHQRALKADPVVEGRLGAFFATLGVTVDSPVGQAARRAYNEVLPDVLEWMDGAPELLARLRGRYRLGIVTNGPSEIQRPKLDKFNLASLVDAVIVSGEVGVHKPDAAIFAHLLHATGVPAGSAAHIGDSLSADVAGAHAAGMTALWLPPRHRAAEERAAEVAPPDAVLASLSDLASL